MRAFRWADALADRLEVGPVTAGLIADQLNVPRDAVLFGARSIPGSWTDPATGFVRLPENPRRRVLGTLLSSLTYVVPLEVYQNTAGRLRRRWARGNFSVPRDLTRALKASPWALPAKSARHASRNLNLYGNAVVEVSR